MKTIEEFAKKVQEDTLKNLNEMYPDSLDKYPDMWVKDAQTTIRPGKKYTKVDVGSSGKYMVVNETGEIFGIKAYGVIHFGHFYGTLETIDDYFWGRYDAVKINNAPTPKIIPQPVVPVVVEKEEPAPVIEARPKKAQAVIDYFHTLRFDPNHHLGLGDIRLTIAQQEEIIQMVEAILSPEKVVSLPLASKEARRQLRLNRAARTNFRNCKRNGFPMYY